jgi:hypothetical protein
MILWLIASAKALGGFKDTSCSVLADTSYVAESQSSEHRVVGTNGLHAPSSRGSGGFNLVKYIINDRGYGMAFRIGTPSSSEQSQGDCHLCYYQIPNRTRNDEEVVSCTSQTTSGALLHRVWGRQLQLQRSHVLHLFTVNTWYQHLPWAGPRVVCTGRAVLCMGIAATGLC